MIARGLLVNVESLGDLAVAHALGHQLQDLLLSCRQVFQPQFIWGDRLRRRERQELFNRRFKLLPCRLIFQQYPVAAVKRYEPGAGNEPGQCTTLFERNTDGSARMKHQRGTANLRR